MTRFDMISSLHPTSGAEVGTLRGDFASELMQIPTLKTLHVIDAWTHFPGAYELDPANVDQGGQDERERFVRTRFEREPRIIVRKGLSLDVAASMGTDSLDFVFLDAMHTYSSVYDDLVAWSCVAKVLLIHDYLDTEATREMGFDVVRAANTFCAHSDWRLAEISNEDWPTAMFKML